MHPRSRAAISRLEAFTSMHNGPTTHRAEPTRQAAPGAAAAAPVDIELFAKNLARMVEEAGKALAAYLKPREEGRIHGEYAEFIDVVKTLGQIGNYWLKDPQRALVNP